MATIIGSEEIEGDTVAAEIGTAEVEIMSMQMTLPCVVLSGTSTGAKHADINFASTGNATVSFDPRNSADSIEDIPTDKDGSITLPTPAAWNGYTFAGWYKSIDGKGGEADRVGGAGDTYQSAVTGVLYAKWTKDSKTVRTEALNLTGAAPTNPGDQGWTWDENTKTLALNGFNLGRGSIVKKGSDMDYVGLMVPYDAKIVLANGSENSINSGDFIPTGPKDWASNYGIQAVYLGGDIQAVLEISGKGRLDITSGEPAEGGYSYAIYTALSLTVKDAKLTANTPDAAQVDMDSTCISVASNITITGDANVTATASDVYAGRSSTGISCLDNLVVSGNAVVTATGGSGHLNEANSSYGIYVSDDMTVSENAKVTATAGKVGGDSTYPNTARQSLGMRALNLTVSGDAVINATGGEVWNAPRGYSMGINVDRGTTISNNAKVVATGGDVDAYEIDGKYYTFSFGIGKADSRGSDQVVISDKANIIAVAGKAIYSYGIGGCSQGGNNTWSRYDYVCEINGGKGKVETLSENSATYCGAFYNQPTGTIGATLTNYKDKKVVWPAVSAVTFDARNGVDIEDAEIGDDGKITVPDAPTWTGYTFAGWWTGIDGTGTEFVNSGLTDSVTVYAKWTKDGKTVRTTPLDLLDASVTNPGDQGWTFEDNTLTLNGATIDCSGIPAAEGEVFGIQLMTDYNIVLAEGTTNTVKAGASSDDLSMGIYFMAGLRSVTSPSITGKGTLYVTGGDSGEHRPSNGILADETLTVSDATVHMASGKSKYGYGFEGDLNVKSGTIKAIGTGTVYGIGISARNMTMSGGNVTTTGNSDPSRESYGIYGQSLEMTGGTLSASGKTAVSMEDPIIAQGATVTNGTADNDGGVFVSGTTTTLTQTDTTDPVVISIAPAVSFDVRNGSPISTVDINTDAGTITMPANPTWTGYTFAGWYTGIDGTGTKFVNSGLTDSVTVYAKWTAANGKTVRTESLDLTASPLPTNPGDQGWSWDATNSTLTLDGLTLNSVQLDENDGAVGIRLPAGACTIILTDGTENTADVSAAKVSDYSAAIYSGGTLTIKISGKGAPGKLNAIAGKATGASVGIYAEGGIVIESGSITATAGESESDNSIGISADTSDIHIKNGTVTATGGKSGADISGGDLSGSFGLYGTNVQIDDGTVTAIGGAATLSGGIVGGYEVKLNGGSIRAKGNLAAVAALSGNLTIDDIANVTVNGQPAKVGVKNIGVNISTLLDESNAIIADALIKFKPAYTGTNPLAPNAPKATKTHNSITLEVQTVTGETVEYGIEKADGTIAWQNSNLFENLTADTTYKFFARVKANANHKAGAASAETEIKTKPAPTTVSGTVKDSDDSTLDNVLVELKQGDTVIKSDTTKNGGKYILSDVPAGVYKLVVTRGTAPNTVVTTRMITVAGSPLTAQDVQFLNGDKNTVVESKPGAPDVAVGGLNDLLNPANIGTTLTDTEKAAVDAGGSVVLKFAADVKAAADVAGDKSKIESIATGKKIDLLLDLSVLKTVKAGDSTVLSNGIKITSLAGLIEVYLPIPAELQDKAGLALYRVHDGKEQALSLDTPDAITGEYYTIDSSGEFMTLHVKNFSTYALGYDAFTVTISGGGDGASSGGRYSSGETVTINAGTKSGFTFSGWTSSPSVSFANASSASTTFTMPSDNITVTAHWTDNGGGGSTGGGGGGTTTYPNPLNQPENGTVSIAPKSPSKGQTVTVTTKPDAGYVVDTVIVRDANGKTIAVTEKGVNSYTFVQPGSKVTVEVTYTKAQTSGEKTFTDMTTNDWFYDAVMAATANGWFSGTSATTFSPNAPTTRGMIATILHRMENTPGAAAASFTDVASDAYYAGGVAWAQEHGIVTGYGNGNYGPNNNITREQLAAILYRYAAYKGHDMSKTAALGSFADANSVSGYATDAMSWAVGSGLISGRGNNTLAPTATATRAEVAVILVRFEELFVK